MPYYLFFSFLSLGRLVVFILIVIVIFRQFERFAADSDLLDVIIFSIGIILTLMVVCVYRIKIVKITGKNGQHLTVARDSRGRGILIDENSNQYSLSSIFGWKIGLRKDAPPY